MTDWQETGKPFGGQVFKGKMKYINKRIWTGTVAGSVDKGTYFDMAMRIQDVFSLFGWCNEKTERSFHCKAIGPFFFLKETALDGNIFKGKIR